MTSTKQSLADIRREIVGTLDDYHYRSATTGRRITDPTNKKLASVWLCSENDRYGYRGIVRIDRHPLGGWIKSDAEIFEQDNPRSFAAMLRDAAELGW